MPTERPRLLVVAPRQRRGSSYDIRIASICSHPQFGFDTTHTVFWKDELENHSGPERASRLRQHSQGVDLILLQRVLLDRLASQVLFDSGKPLVFDYDDAIQIVPAPHYLPEAGRPWKWGKWLARWLLRGRPNRSGRYRQLVQMLKRVDGVSAGNANLQHFAAQYCRQTAVVPTTVDVDNLPQKQHRANQPLVVGWYGRPDSQWHLNEVLPALRKLQTNFGDRMAFHIISSDPWRPEGLNVHWVPWQLATEVADLMRFDIGIMPLSNDESSQGKSAAKAIFYMGLGIPAVVSPVGVNAEVVTDGESGYHAHDSSQWVERITALAESEALRRRMGHAARQRVSAHYSREVAVRKLSALLKECLRSA